MDVLASAGSTTKQPLRVGDYPVHDRDGSVLAVVERKSLADLVATLSGGKLRYLMSTLASVPHAALVVEDRYSSIFKLDRVRPAVVAEAQVRFPTVPIVFAETRPLAQEWAYRFFGAALTHHNEHDAPDTERLPFLASAGPIRAPEASVAAVRAWAIGASLDVAAKGRLRPEISTAYKQAHSSS